ncbi:MAG: hypothetical protein GY865_16635 [candidate division Zixibacteria bacterium]|nr:hypothetical protein [candidate division Zixibacteria bacterium]
MWIKNTKQAVCKLSGLDVTLLTSVGMKTWELLVYLAVKYKIKQHIYVPITIKQKNIDVIAYYTKQFRLSPKLTEWYFFEIENQIKDNRFFQKERDKLICNSADIIYPISIRKDSTLKRLYDSDESSKAVVDERFTVNNIKTKKSYKYEIDKEKLNLKIDTQLDQFIIHWTRTANNNWPGEKLSDYYKSIVNSKNNYAHSAYMTLLKILSEKGLRSSSRHYRKNLSAVSFSELKPSDAIDLMKWRARYREMSFEPYGIAIKKNAANKIGIRKVIYGDSNMFKDLKTNDKPYFQSVGTKGFWTPEKEWRHIGDIDLSKINTEDLKIIVQSKEQIDLVKKHSKSEIISLYT